MLDFMKSVMEYIDEVKPTNSHIESKNDNMESYYNVNQNIDEKVYTNTLESRNIITNTVIPYKTEVKLCYRTLQGETKRGIPNLILHKDGHTWRVRSEILLFKGDKILLVKKNKINQYGVMYIIPGGGIDDPYETVEETAERECREEAHIIPKNVRFTGITSSRLYKIIPEWHKTVLWPDGIKYDGYITFICIGEYDRDFRGYVKVMDRQSDFDAARFYKYDECKDLLSPEHRKIAEEYLTKNKVSNKYSSQELSQVSGIESFVIESSEYSKYTKNYKTFDDFCNAMDTPYDIVNWYKLNKVYWHEMNSEGPFVWPDELIHTHAGICYDHAVFMHYFCKKKGWENYIMCVTVYEESPGTYHSWWANGHVVCIFKFNGLWYIFDPTHNINSERNVKQGDLRGPYKSMEEAKKWYTKYYDVLMLTFWKMKGRSGKRIPAISRILSKQDEKKLDSIYGKKDIGRDDFSNKNLPSITTKYDRDSKIEPTNTYEYILYNFFDIYNKIRSKFP